MFKLFALLESVRNLLQNPYDITHITLGMLIHYLGKLQIQIFCRVGRKHKQIAFWSPLTLLFIHNFYIFGVYHSEPFSVLIANKVFHVIVLLLIYFCDQLVALEIRHSTETSLQCLSTINMVFINEDKIFDKKFVFEGVHSKEVDRRISWESWTKRGVSKLLKKLRDTGTVDRQRQIVQCPHWRKRWAVNGLAH